MTGHYLQLRTRLALAAALLGAAPALAAPVSVDPAIGSYAKVGGISGNLSSVGSTSSCAWATS